MNRRDFLKLSTTAGLALASGATYAAAPSEADIAAIGAHKRVGVIGCGWYGKNDLFRLIQVAPVDVAALCDVDKNMLENAADMTATRQASKKKPRTYHDYRDMLKEQQLDIVLVATPDHWHALAMIAAVQAGPDVYVQKPISADVLEGQAMLAAARKHGRVVQVGTQRRSTPHLIEARDRIVNTGKLGKVGLVEICCYYPMRTHEHPAPETPPAYFDYEMWTGPAPMRPYTHIVHPRSWRNFMEYGNGIIGDMAIHMFDMSRWMLGLGWPRTVSSSGGILIDKASIADISDTQSAVFDYGDMQIVWQHRTWGTIPDPQYAWSAILYGDKGTLKLSLMSYDFIPHDGSAPIHGDVVYELDKYPEDRTEKNLEKHCAPATRQHMRNFLANIASRGRPVADIEQGYISTTSCILANLSMNAGRSLAWDIDAGNIKNDDEANKLLRRPYRDPWQHPTPETV